MANSSDRSCARGAATLRAVSETGTEIGAAASATASAAERSAGVVRFDEPSHQDWESAAVAALGGEPLSGLDSTLLDGIVTSPLYTPSEHGTENDPAGLPGSFPFARGAAATSNRAGWEIRQTHDVRRAETPDAVAVDTTAGVNAITVARGWDVELHAAALAAGIAGAAAAGATIHLAAGTTPAHAEAFAAVLDEAGTDLRAASSWLGIDPAARFVTGWIGPSDASNRSEGFAAEVSGAADAAVSMSQRWPATTPLESDGSVFADAGASDAGELGAALAGGLMWLRALSDVADRGDLGVAAASGLVGFTLSGGPDPFVTAAKCRALRVCWTRVLQACGVDLAAEGRQLPLKLHAVTSTAMLARRDPWVNMLRSTAACFGAIIGGADAITVQPFDAAGAVTPDGGPLGLRVAANTQLMLAEESRVGAVIDPGGGSWYLEELTAQMAREAWQRFQSIEAAGGMCDALASGQLYSDVATDRARRDEAITAGQRVLVGVNEFVADDEHVAEAPPQNATSPRWGLHRWAAAYENSSHEHR